MDKCVVAVIGNNKARFFTLEEAEWPEYESGPNLVEQESLSPSASGYGHDLWSKIANKYSHRSQEADSDRYQFERKFAQKIASEIVNLVRINQGQTLILVAKPQILNAMQKLFVPTIFNGLKIKALRKDISHFKPSQVHQYLAQKQLIPACQKVVYPR